VEEMARKYLQEKAQANKMTNRIFLLVFVCVFVVGSATLMCYFAMDSLKQFKVQGDGAVEQPHAVLVSTDGRSILQTHEATIDIEGSVLLQKSGDEFLLKDEDLEGVMSVAYMNNQTLHTDGHWYGTFSSYVVQGLARTSTSVSFITARGHEIRLLEKDEFDYPWEVLYLDHVSPPRSICEEEDEGDGRGRLLVTIRRNNLDTALAEAYAVEYQNYF
jgi:hypothetical protein